MLAVLLSFVFLADYAFGRMCMVCWLQIFLYIYCNEVDIKINPYQRGGVVPDINTVGAPECNVNDYNNGTSPGSPPCYAADNPDERISQFIGMQFI